jgi:hypothetical protein
VTDHRAHAPFAGAFAFAPILIGAASALLGLAVFAFLARPAGPPEEAGVRLFGVIFLAWGVTLISVGAGAFFMLGARRRGSSAGPPLVLLAFTTILLIALIAPFHLWWRAPWPAFQNTVFLLDAIAIVFLLRFVARFVTRHRPSRRPLSAAARSRWTFVGLFLGISGVMVGTLGAQQAAADWRGWSGLRPVRGIVIRQHSFNFRDPDRGTVSSGVAVVQYSVDGKSFEATLPMNPSSQSFRRGAEIDLLYSPAQPGAAQPATAFHIFLIGGVLLVTAVTFLGLASAAFVRATFRI